MMKHAILKIIAAVTLTVAVATPTFADESAIKARKALMQLRAFNIGQLGAMAKGAVDYNAEAAQAAADNLVATTTINQMAMWPQGTDNVAMAGKTGALPELWATFPAVFEKDKAFVEAATAMAAVAGTDLASLQGAMGTLGGGCGGCHKLYKQAAE